MAAEVNQKKIERLFDKLLDKNYQIKTDTYLNRLLTHLTDEKHEIAVRQTFIAEWLKNAITEWHENSSIPNSNITSFLLNLISFLSKNEEFFNLLKDDNFYTKLFHVLHEEKNNAKCPSIKLGYVKILTAFLDHNSGILFVTSTDYWKTVIELCLSTQTLYITRECNKFIFKLLQKSGNEFLDSVVEQICLPLSEDSALVAIQKSCGAMEICDALIYERIKSSLQLLYALFESILKSEEFSTKDYNLGLVIADKHKMEARIDNLMLIAYEQNFLFDLQKIALCIYFTQIFSSIFLGKNDGEGKNCLKIMNLLRVNIAKDYVNNILKLLCLCQIYWGLHGHNVPATVFNKNNMPLTLGDQFVCLQLITFIALKNSPKTSFCTPFEDELKDLYIKKLFDIMCETTLRIGYQWRDLLSTKDTIFDIAQVGLNYFLQSKKYLTRDRAIIAFQGFVYLLKDIIKAMRVCPEKICSIVKISLFISQILNLIEGFIEEFAITWRDSVETICVLSIAVEFLKIPAWPTGFVVQALKLANISIVKYMSPSLALLVDDTTNTTMAEIGSVLYAKLHDGAWEVRDTALEVVCTIAHISNTKLNDCIVFLEWISKAVTIWEKNLKKIQLQANLICFILNLTKILAKNEDRFNFLNTNNFYIKLLKISKVRQNGAPLKIKLCYIQLLYSFLGHSSGLEWMTSCNYYEDIVKISVQRTNGEILSASREFLITLLGRTVRNEEEFCSDLVRKIMEPFTLLHYCEENNESLSLALQLLSHTLDHFLEAALLQNGDLRVLLLFLKHFHYEKIFTNFMAMARNKFFMLDLTKIMFTMQYLEVYVNFVAKKISFAELCQSLDRIMVNFTNNFIQGAFEDVLPICEFGHLYWSLICKKLPVPHEKITNYKKSITLIQLMPNFMLFICCFPLPSFAEKYDEDVRSEFMLKVFKISPECVVRVLYSWRSFLMVTPNLYQFAAIALKSLNKSRKFFDKERATIIVQGFVHIFQDFIDSGKDNHEKLEGFVRQSQLLADMFNTLGVLLEEFEITWRESIETTDVMALSFDYLSMPVWPVNVTQEILKLLRISIAKYMAPNLALLIDRTNDSTIALMGPLIYAKLFDSSVEIRTETLEIVHTIACLSKSKFPSLQKVIMDSELPSLVLKMSTGDGEGFVRATAIKCLQEMIQVDEIWSNCLKAEHLSEKVRLVLRNETEGIVRVEAATFMCTAFEQQQILDEDLDKVYESMMNAATTDLHWEVKVKALNFWSRVIDNQLHHQGMIDGTFPKVTFSREHRKIVTLTESEIRRRLEKVLVQLSSNGCLGVLTTAIKDDCDVEVSKKACEVAKKLLKLLKQYKVQGTNSVPSSPIAVNPSPSTSMSSGVSTGCDEGPRTPEFTNDDIIEQIVNERDVNLLKSVYVESDYGSICNLELPQFRKIVRPAEFLEMFAEQDLDQIILDKRNWLNGMDNLDSLLDDMLKSYEEGEREVNTMDCY